MEDDKKSKGVASNFVKGAILSVIAFLLLFGVISGIIGYKYGWGDRVKESVRVTFDLPAAKVNGTAIPYSDFTSDLESARHFFGSAAAAGTEAPNDSELRKGVMDRLIQQEIIKEAANQYGLSVTQDEIDAEFKKLADTEGGDSAQQIEELYGWTIDQFKEKVMKYYVLEGKLSEALANDPEVTAEAESKANDVLARLDAGEDFADVAADVSDDPGSRDKGGELGSFGRGTMVKPFEDAAFSLKPGERSGLVKTQYGYHIIEVTDNKVGDDGEIEEVTARHILIGFPSISDYLDKKVAEADVEKLID